MASFGTQWGWLMDCPSTSREISGSVSPCSAFVLIPFNVFNWWHEHRGRHGADSRLQITHAWKGKTNKKWQSKIIRLCKPLCSQSPLSHSQEPYLHCFLSSVHLQKHRVRMGKLKFWEVQWLALSHRATWPVFFPLSLRPSDHNSQRANNWNPGQWHLSHPILSVCWVLYMLRICMGQWHEET